MKILYLHESVGSLGGAEANVFITATEFKKRDIEVCLIGLRPTGKNLQAWDELFSSGLTYLKNPDDLPKHLDLYKPTVIYVHKFSDTRVLRALVDSGYPIIRMVHDHDIYCMRSYRYNVFTRNICRRKTGPYCIFPCLATIKRNRSGGSPIQWVSYFDKLKEIELARQFDRTLVVTNFMREELLTNGFDQNKISIFPPVPRPGEALESNFSERNLILYAGQIIRGKGVDILLKALARVTQPFEAVILGDGNQKAYCEKLSKELGLEGRVSFKGFIPQEELKGYYRETSVVAISSLWPEPIATIGLEVMRYGLPVVAFDAGGIKDWLRDGQNGYLVPWMDIDQYAKKIDQLLLDKKLAKTMGQKGLEIVSQEYDFDEYLDNLISLFETTARLKSTSSAPI